MQLIEDPRRFADWLQGERGLIGEDVDINVMFEQYADDTCCAHDDAAIRAVTVLECECGSYGLADDDEEAVPLASEVESLRSKVERMAADHLSAESHADETIAQLEQLARDWDDAAGNLCVDHDYVDAEDELRDTVSQVYAECAAALRRRIGGAK